MNCTHCVYCSNYSIMQNRVLQFMAGRVSFWNGTVIPPVRHSGTERSGVIESLRLYRSLRSLLK